MGRTKKEFDKNGAFQTRFREQYRKNYRTQEQLAKALGVSRPTVVGWLDGKNIPDILSLTEIAKLFGVSADYLLGLSDTACPDVSVAAVVKYTGLSEKAVKRLHFGLDDRLCNGVILSKKKKKKELRLVSLLIQSDAYYGIVENLNEVTNEAYARKILTILLERYFKPGEPIVNPEFCFANEDERNVVKDNLINILKIRKKRESMPVLEKIAAMSDCDLLRATHATLYDIETECELHQFYATKAFNSFVDLLVKGSYQRAKQRFAAK